MPDDVFLLTWRIVQIVGKVLSALIHNLVSVPAHHSGDDAVCLVRIVFFLSFL